MSVNTPPPHPAQPPRPIGRTEVDDQHPWLGLDAFTEELSDYFYGRTDEAEELFRRVKRESLTVLFGTSGLGKTSLIRAGLFPALRAEGFLPVYIRLDHEPTAKAFILQVKAALTEAIIAARISQPTLPETDETLWEFFHRDSLHLQTWNGQPITPVLVIDQFEELFTLGARDEAAQQNYEMLFTELSDLVENHPPARVRERLRSNPEQVADLGFGPAHVRVLFSLREDYLANLEACYELIPSISRNRMRLTLMNGQQALDAVILPGAELVSREVGEQIVRFVAAAGQRQVRADSVREHGLRELDIEPALLSLFCSELNGQRIAKGLSQISADLVEKSSEQILNNYYEGCFAGQAAGARVFVEEELLTPDGYRDDMEFKRAKEELSKRGAMATSLDELIECRLLHRTPRGETLRVELTHDVLTGVVRDSRDERRLREAREEAEAKQREAEAMLLRRAEAERKAKEDAEASAREAAERAAVLDEALQKETQARKEADLATRRARWLAFAAIFVAIFAAVALIFALAAQAEKERQRAEAEKQRAAAQQAKEKAVALKKAADELIIFMQYDLRDTLGDLGQLRMMEGINARIRRYHEEHPPEPGDEAARDAADRERSVALDQQGDILRDQGQLAQALKAYRDSLEIRERLTRKDPDNADRQRNLSLSYINVGAVQRAQGDLAGALKSYHDSLGIREKLAKQDPGNAGWQRDLSVSYDNVGDVQSDQGDLAGALKSYRDSLGIREKLAKQDPGNAGWQRDLSVSYINVGAVQSDQGDLAGALKSYRDSLGIAEKLAKQDPGNAGWQRDLFVSYNKVGDVQSDQGDLAGALKSYRDGLGIAEKLAKQDPGNAGWQRDLTVSYINVGAVQRAQGDLAGALKSYHDSLGIREKLAKQDPGNAGWQRDLTVSYDNVGDVQSAQGDLAGALKSYRDSLGIREKLAKQDPGNAGWQRDLSVSYINVGAVQSAQGDLAGALKSYRDSLGIAEKLAKQDPGNAGWQRDLSVSYDRVGDVQSAQGDLAGALKSYRDSLGIAEKLAKQDPGNAGWQGDLAWVYWQTGAAWAQVEPKSRNESREMVEKGRDILRQLKERTGLTAQQQKWLDLIEANLQQMQEKK